jgi:hypothetical protein
MTADTDHLALTARNASIEDLVALLRGQARKVDMVAPASAIRAEGGCLVLDGTVPVLGEDGVTMTEGRYRPSDVCDAGIAEKLSILAAYLKRMRACKPALFDANINGGLAGTPGRSSSAACAAATARPGSRGRGCRTGTRPSTTSRR